MPVTATSIAHRMIPRPILQAQSLNKTWCDLFKALLSNAQGNVGGTHTIKFDRAGKLRTTLYKTMTFFAQSYFVLGNIKTQKGEKGKNVMSLKLFKAINCVPLSDQLYSTKRC